MQVIAIGRKANEIVDRQRLTASAIQMVYFAWHEVPIAALQPFCANIETSCLVTANLFAGVLNLAASRRLMLETLLTTYRKPRGPGLWPTFSEWLAVIENIRVNAMSRLGQYREAALFALKSLYIELHDAIDYAASSFLKQLETYEGIVVISTARLSAEAESLFAALLVNAAFQNREGKDPEKLDPLIFVLDDCMPLIQGTSQMDAEGSNRNPLATFTHMGRSRRIGFVMSAQNFSAISPSVVNNCATLIAFSSYGEDAEKLKRHLCLTPEQAATLPTLQPGECVAMARTVHPLAVRGGTPMIE